MLISQILCEANERPVRIIGPAEHNINRTKQLPVRSGVLNELPSYTSDKTVPMANRKFLTAGGQTSSYCANNNTQPISSHRKLLQSLSDDGSLGEGKCFVGQYSIKITGDHFELVEVAKRALDDYFSSNEFLQSAIYNGIMSSSSSIQSMPTMIAPAMKHSEKSSSPIADNSLGLIVEIASTISNSIESSVTAVDTSMANGVKRRRRTHFTRKDLEEMTNTKECAVNYTTRTRRTHFSRKDFEGEITMETDRKLRTEPMVYKYEKLSSPPDGGVVANTEVLGNLINIYECEELKRYSKLPPSVMPPKDLVRISKIWPEILLQRNVFNDKI